MSPFNYPLPSSTAAQLADKEYAPQNPGLLFERCVPLIAGMSEDEAKGIKSQVLDRIVLAAQKADKELLKECLARWKKAAQSISASPFSLKTEWRLVAGLGRKGQLEVGFTFHRYGFPYLPGSSVKGIARAMALAELCEAWEDGPDLTGWDQLLNQEDEKKYKKAFESQCPTAPAEIVRLASDFRTVFGTQECAGWAIYLDAMPEKAPTLEVDIMNPHYSEYYQGMAAPTNWQKPIPVPFLTCAKDTIFWFAVGWRGPVDPEGQRMQALAQAWLLHGLTRLGAGAKTNAGYGFFTNPAEKTPETFASPPPEEKPQPVPELIVRRGKIIRIDATKGGTLQDLEDGREYRFGIRGVIQGNTPGKGTLVTFKLDGSKVVFIQRA